MFKILTTFVITLVCVTDSTVIKDRPYIPQDEFGVPDVRFWRSTAPASNFVPHIMDFLQLMDMEKMVMVAMQYMADPEVMMFMKFLLSHEFKEVVFDFEMMDEFKEAVEFLSSRGYDVESVINYVNTALNLPPFVKPNYLLTENKGISGFFEAMIDTMPLEDMKKLFETKLETSPEVGDLFETVKSEEFMDIMKRMRENPKFTEIKMIFEGYGIDFKLLCNKVKDIFGDYYQGVFCE